MKSLQTKQEDNEDENDDEEDDDYEEDLYTGCLFQLVPPMKIQSTVISVIMPPLYFYRKYVPPFFDGSFLNILR